MRERTGYCVVCAAPRSVGGNKEILLCLAVLHLIHSSRLSLCEAGCTAGRERSVACANGDGRGRRGWHWLRLRSCCLGHRRSSTRARTASMLPFYLIARIRRRGNSSRRRRAAAAAQLGCQRDESPRFDLALAAPPLGAARWICAFLEMPRRPGWQRCGHRWLSDVCHRQRKVRSGHTSSLVVSGGRMLHRAPLTRLVVHNRLIATNRRLIAAVHPRCHRLR